MNYELAKELKDAGFPQMDNTDYFYRKYPTGEYHRYTSALLSEIEAGTDRIACPALSELIAACGQDFERLQYRAGNKLWLASGTDTITTPKKTPEEAVARLWLALNKK